MSTLYISSKGSVVSASGVWRVSSSDYQYNYNAFTPGEDVNLDQVSISTNTYDAGQSNPGNFQVGVYAAGVNASTPGSLISYLSGPTSPTAGAYNSYTPTTSISLQAGTQYWLGFTLSSDTGGSNSQRVKISTSDGTSTYTSPGWSVGTRYTMGSSAGLPDNSSRPATFELYGTSRAVCFCSGTAIRTASGEVPIEDIKIGDVVATSKGPMSVKWVAKRTISKMLVTDEFYLSAIPIVIRANSLEDGVPSKDLYVSESHGIYADGKIINACYLANDLTISKASSNQFKTSIQYYHLEFDDEVLVSANNTLSCSYVNTGNRRSFDNYPEFISMYGDVGVGVRSRLCSAGRNRPTRRGHKLRVARSWDERWIARTA
jgi:hypothetical protein